VQLPVAFQYIFRKICDRHYFFKTNFALNLSENGAGAKTYASMTKRAEKGNARVCSGTPRDAPSARLPGAPQGEAARAREGKGAARGCATKPLLCVHVLLTHAVPGQTSERSTAAPSSTGCRACCQLQPTQASPRRQPHAKGPGHPGSSAGGLCASPRRGGSARGRRLCPGGAPEAPLEPQRPRDSARTRCLRAEGSSAGRSRQGRGRGRRRRRASGAEVNGRGAAKRGGRRPCPAPLRPGSRL